MSLAGLGPAHLFDSSLALRRSGRYQGADPLTPLHAVLRLNPPRGLPVSAAHSPPEDSHMTRNYLSLATVLALSLAGCAKNNTTDTQNPGTTTGDPQVDGSAGDGTGDTASGPSRARTSTAPRGAGRNTKARNITTSKPVRTRLPDAPTDETGPNGLMAEVYALDALDALPDFSTLDAPAESFPVPNLDFDETKASEGFPGVTAAKENYAVRFSGSINVVEEAEYDLCLHSDDGSQLLLEDTLVVDNDGVLDNPTETCELVYLAPGEYRIEVRYFQATGPLLAMHFAWSINGADKVIVPSEVLFKPESAPS